MQVSFYSYIRDAAGCKNLEISSCPDVRTLLWKLSAQLGSEFRSKVLSADGNALNEEVVILINGFHFDQAHEGLDKKLSPDDNLDIFPAVGGG